MVRPQAVNRRRALGLLAGGSAGAAALKMLPNPLEAAYQSDPDAGRQHAHDECQGADERARAVRPGMWRSCRTAVDCRPDDRAVPEAGGGRALRR
jgi:hypothetical protein